MELRTCANTYLQLSRAVVTFILFWDFVGSIDDHNEPVASLYGLPSEIRVHGCVSIKRADSLAPMRLVCPVNVQADSESSRVPLPTF